MTLSNFKKTFPVAFPHTIPVLTGCTVLGIAYGILMQSKGYGPLWSGLMSAIAFCGSMQFIAITLLTVAFDPVQAFLLSFMVNARHLFYGIAMLDRYKGLGKIRYFLMFTLSDETFSIGISIKPPEGVDRACFYLWISLLTYFYWIFGTLLGASAGSFIHFNTAGLDFVLTALFVVLFLEQIRLPGNRVPGILGIGCTLVALLVFGANNVVIPAMVIILVALLLGRSFLWR